MIFLFALFFPHKFGIFFFSHRYIRLFLNSRANVNVPFAPISIFFFFLLSKMTNRLIMVNDWNIRHQQVEKSKNGKISYVKCAKRDRISNSNGIYFFIYILYVHVVVVALNTLCLFCFYFIYLIRSHHQQPLLLLFFLFPIILNIRRQKKKIQNRCSICIPLFRTMIHSQ